MSPYHHARWAEHSSPERGQPGGQPDDSARLRGVPRASLRSRWRGAPAAAARPRALAVLLVLLSALAFTPPAQAQPSQPTLEAKSFGIDGMTPTGPDDVRLFWKYADGGGVPTTQRLEYKKADQDWNDAESVQAADGTTEHTLSPGPGSTFDPHKAYDYRIRGANADGEGLWSEVTTFAGRPVHGREGPWLQPFDDDPREGFQFFWRGPESDGGKEIDKYVYQWKTTSDDYDEARTRDVEADIKGPYCGENLDGSISCSGVARELTPGTEYEFRVRADNDSLAV